MDNKKPSIFCRCIFFTLVLVVSLILVWLCVERYRAYNVTMNDLGNMSQAIWSATQGEPLVFTSKHGPMSRLALHVELFYFLLVPLYKIFPSPVILLIFQVLLFVAGAFPLYILAKRRLENCWTSLAIVTIYLFCPIAQSAVLYDFHGDTLAMPMLVFAIEALDRRSWSCYILWTLLALSCKFYVAIPIVALGVTLWFLQCRNAGLRTTILGIGWGLITFLVIRPLFAPPIGTGLESASVMGYFTFYFGHIFESIRTTWLSRLSTAIIVFLPALWAGWYAPAWLIPAASVGLPALMSSGPGPSYRFSYHHYALVVPFLMASVIYGFAAMRKNNFTMWPFALFATLISTLIVNSALLYTPLNLGFWASASDMKIDTIKDGRSERDVFKDRWLASNVPSEVPLAASRFLAAHVVNRHTLYITETFYDYIDEVDYVLPDSLFDHVMFVKSGDFIGGVTYDWKAVQWMFQRPDFGLIAAQDGLLLFKRNASPEQILHQRTKIIPIDSTPPLQANFRDFIGLAKTDVKMIGTRRFRLTYDWVALRSLKDLPGLFAVSQLQGVEQSRIVHLPTLYITPVTSWKQGSLIREEFEIVLPSNLPSGSYPLSVGWYYSSSAYAFATDDRSRFGSEIMTHEIQVP